METIQAPSNYASLWDSAQARYCEAQIMIARKDLGIAQAARQVPCAEGTLRRLDRQGVVRPNRDPWGRRLFGPDDVEAARKHLQAQRAGQAAA
jgi:hypothetical protein